MIQNSFSVAIPEAVHLGLYGHLKRADGQEDLCFAIWYPSQGEKRLSGLIQKIILPEKNERIVHGNVSFLPKYYERALFEAVKAGGGLAFMHSHLTKGWQDMSDDDVEAERSHAASALAATGLPLLGLTMGTDGAWSARYWIKTKPKHYDRKWCSHVRVVGNAFKVTYHDKILPPPEFRKELSRTISAWGQKAQNDLARLKIGVIGLGSVGSIVAESLARMGIKNIVLIDFDKLKFENLDRTLNAKRRDAKKDRYKVDVSSDALKESATALNFKVEPIKGTIYDDQIFRKALDCDILFSCVDRPLPRSILNFIAYAHLIPVVDGGIRVNTTLSKELKRADWKVHIASPSRRCLECLEQYTPALAQLEVEGYFEDPRYIDSLSDDHEIKRNENVFAFSLSVASMEILQMLLMVISPLGVSNTGQQTYHFVGGIFDKHKFDPCKDLCPYPGLIARGDHSGFKVTK